MDTDKGLISFSSNLPTPPPPPYRAKPLPEELRSKIIASFGDDVCYAFYASHIEPSKCIDPDYPSSWAHLEKKKEKTYYYPINTHLFSPNQDPLVPGKKIDGSPVFELYYIKIKKLDPLREFSSIFMEGSNTNHRSMIIYKRPEGKEITLDEPLPLKNIFRPPSALKDVTIALSNPACGGWRLRCGPPYLYPEDMKYGRRIQKVKDELTESVAVISYELIKSAAIAELAFTLINEEGCSIKILSGSMSVMTTDGKAQTKAQTKCMAQTKRIIRQFSSSEPLVLPKSNKGDVPVPVHRSVFGVPLGKSLCFNANLSYVLEGDCRLYKMKRTLNFSVPNQTQSVENFIVGRSGPAVKMKVKVSWWDFMV